MGGRAKIEVCFRLMVFELLLSIAVFVVALNLGLEKDSDKNAF